jgi:hypothetical protein
MDVGIVVHKKRLALDPKFPQQKGIVEGDLFQVVISARSSAMSGIHIDVQ